MRSNVNVVVAFLLGALLVHELARAQATPAPAPAPAADAPCKVWDLSIVNVKIGGLQPSAFLGSASEGWEPFTSITLPGIGGGDVLLARKCSKR